MSVFCKIGMHRWKIVGSSGIFMLPLSECSGCGKGKIKNLILGPTYITPEDMAKAKKAQAER